MARVLPASGLKNSSNIANNPKITRPAGYHTLIPPDLKFNGNSIFPTGIDMEARINAVYANAVGNSVNP